MSLSFANEAFRAFAITASVLVLKTLAMAPLTVRERCSRGECRSAPPTSE